MAVYQAGVTVYLVGRNVVNAAWARTQMGHQRRAFNPMDGEALSFYVERPLGVPSLEAFVEYVPEGGFKQFPVPPDVITKLVEICTGYAEQFTAALQTPSGIILPGPHN